MDSGYLLDCGSCAQRLNNHKHIFSRTFAHRLSGKGSLATISSIPERIMPRFTRENTIEEKQRMRNEQNKRKRLLRTAKKTFEGRFTLPSLKGFIAKMKRIYSIELHIARKGDKLSFHLKKWNKLISVVANGSI